MKDSDGNLLKPYPTDEEISFYETLNTSSDSVVQKMKDFIPTYYGVKNVLVNEEGKGKKGYVNVCYTRTFVLGLTNKIKTEKLFIFHLDFIFT